MKRSTRRNFLKNTGTAMSLAAAGGAFGVLEFPSRAATPEPGLKFPVTPRERLAVATWPFRKAIESTANEYRDRRQPGMDLREFAAQVKVKYGVPGVEPLSSHFPATDARYLGGLREAMEKAGVHAVNLPVDNAASYYDADAGARKQAFENGKKWIDVAKAIGSPSVRTSIAQAANAKPDAEVVSGELRRLADYGAGKGIVVNLENDNLVSEDAFFIVKVIEEAKHPWLRALPDFCNSMGSGSEGFNTGAVTAMFGHAYNICHVKDSEAGEDGKVIRVDLKKMFAILNASYYRGYCSMEWEGAGSSEEGTRQLIAAALKYLAVG